MTHTTSMSEREALRSAFETWYSEWLTGGNVANMPRNANGEYRSGQQEIAWRAYRKGSHAAAQPAPAGWALVPIEPTDAMWNAWRACCTTGDPEVGMAEFTTFHGDYGNWLYAWSKVLEAAPKDPPHV